MLNSAHPDPAGNSLIHRLPRHLKMGELRVFVAVLEHRSFRKAAAVLHLTQPAVTKAVAGLEDTLGVKLFDRLAHGVEPTVHGRSFAPRAVAIFDELRRAAQELTMVSNGTLGNLRVGTVPMPAIPFLPVALNRLLDRQAGILVSLVEERETELLDRLRKRDIELAIMRLALVDAEADLHVEPLFDEQLCVVAAQTHPLASRDRLHWPELLQQRWVLPPADCFFFEHVQRSLARLNMPMPRHAVESMSIQLQFSMVLHAGMLGFGMRSQISFAPGKEFVVRLPFELPLTGTAVAAVSLASHEPSPLARQLVGHIRALVQPPTTAFAPALQVPAAAFGAS
jgi:DNA-binding transcriptional LysR family regulator